MNTEQDFIWQRQYALDEHETYDMGQHRVASHVAKAGDIYFGPATGDADRYQDEQSVKYKRLMEENRFLPGGRVLAGAGTQHGNMLNCFVQDGAPYPPGTTKWVMELARKLALVTKVGGGNGVNLDALPAKRARPAQAERIGDVYFTIDYMHPNRRDVLDGRFMDLALGHYVTKGYQVLQPDDPEKRGDARFIVVNDSVKGIWDAAAKMVDAMLNGTDVLLDFGSLRPEGSPVRGSGGQSSGPASFAVEVFDNFARWAKLGGAEYAGPVATLRYVYTPTLAVIRQGGSRRGAGMATMSITNPDIEDFITSKDLARERNEGAIGTFNISVLVPDSVMQAAKQGDKEANRLLNAIAEHAWQTGEPGVIFVDSINKHNPLAKVDGPILATNP